MIAPIMIATGIDNVEIAPPIPTSNAITKPAPIIQRNKSYTKQKAANAKIEGNINLSGLSEYCQYAAPAKKEAINNLPHIDSEKSYSSYELDFSTGGVGV